MPSNAASTAAGSSAAIFGLIIYVITAVGWWKMFSKAGYPGILAVIPLINVIVYFVISRCPIWYIILLFIPVIDILVIFSIHHGVAKRFGHGVLFALGLMFLTPIFGLILGFGSSTATS